MMSEELTVPKKEVKKRAREPTFAELNDIFTNWFPKKVDIFGTVDILKHEHAWRAAWDDQSFQGSSFFQCFSLKGKDASKNAKEQVRRWSQKWWSASETERSDEFNWGLAQKSKSLGSTKKKIKHSIDVDLAICLIVNDFKALQNTGVFHNWERKFLEKIVFYTVIYFCNRDAALYEYREFLSWAANRLQNAMSRWKVDFATENAKVMTKHSD